jgi:hypothetical protein
MTYQTLLQQLCRIFGLSIILAINADCSSTAEKYVDVLDPDQVSNMRFNVENLSTGFKTSLPKQKISSQVSANLSESGYSVKQDNSAYSHHLRGRIGSVKHSATPVGFSFNAGNSDPRALDFQKADIMPLTCSLISKHQPEQHADLTMDFVANSYLSASEESELVEKLVYDMSTVCFNLLSNLHVERLSANQSNKTIKPGWMPDIEIRNVPEPDIVTEADTKIETESDTKDKKENSISPAEIIQPVKAKQSVDEQHPISIKRKVVKQSNKKTRKQLIINNQGSPVTIQFGHERK